MDETKTGVIRTRAEAEIAKDRPGLTKRRKVVGGGELALSSSSLTHELNYSRKFPQASISQGDATATENESRCSNFRSDGGASCCSRISNFTSDGSAEEGVATEITKYNITESGETTLQPESTSVTSSLRRIITSEKFIIPSEEELEEFFADAEKNLRKQFIDKYNYEISQDEPLSGRYEWVPLKP